MEADDYSCFSIETPKAGEIDLGQDAVIFGKNCKAVKDACAFGRDNQAYGYYSFVEGRENKAGYGAHAEGKNTTASGEYSHSEGETTKASGICSHAEGGLTIASGGYAHAEGRITIASGNFSHSEGNSTTASGIASHAEGAETIASGQRSHSEGYKTQAVGNLSHTEGFSSIANGGASHAEGYSTVTNNRGEHTEGNYNKSNKASDTVGNAGNTTHSVGIGTSVSNRKNAFEIMQNGDVYVLGIGGYDGTNAGASGVKTLQQVISEL